MVGDITINWRGDKSMSYQQAQNVPQGSLDRSGRMFIRANWRDVKQLRDQPEPFIHKDLPDSLQEIMGALRAKNIVVLDKDPSDGRPHGYTVTNGTKVNHWKVHTDAKRLFDEIERRRDHGYTSNGSAGNPLPCGNDDCTVAAFLTFEETIKCKSCGTHYDRQTLEPVDGVCKNEIPRATTSGGD